MTGTIPPIKTIPCPTGNVTLTDNSVALKDFLNSNTGVSSNVATLNSLGFLEDQPVQLPGGNHSLVAAYAGDNSYTASTSAADAVSITKAPTTVAMTPLPGNVGINQAVTLTTTVNTNSSGAGPTGTVTFSSGNTTLGTAPVTGTASNLTTGVPAVGTATLSATFSSSGTKSVTATYSGDGNYTGSGPSTAITINVTTSPGSFTITGTPATVTAGSSGIIDNYRYSQRRLYGKCASDVFGHGTAARRFLYSSDHRCNGINSRDRHINRDGHRSFDDVDSISHLRAALALRSQRTGGAAHQQERQRWERLVDAECRNRAERTAAVLHTRAARTEANSRGTGTRTDLRAELHSGLRRREQQRRWRRWRRRLDGHAHKHNRRCREIALHHEQLRVYRCGDGRHTDRTSAALRRQHRSGRSDGCYERHRIHCHRAGCGRNSFRQCPLPGRFHYASFQQRLVEPGGDWCDDATAHHDSEWIG